MINNNMVIHYKIVLIQKHQPKMCEHNTTKKQQQQTNKHIFSTIHLEIIPKIIQHNLCNVLHM